MIKKSMIIFGVFVLIGGVIITILLNNREEDTPILCDSFYGHQLTRSDLDTEKYENIYELYSGEVVFASNYDKVYYLSENKYVVEKDKKQGIVDQYCNVIQELTKDHIRGATINGERVIIIDENNKYMFYNTELEPINENAFDSIDAALLSSVNTFGAYSDLEISDDSIYYSWIVEQNGLKGLMNIYGELVIPIMYEDIDKFYIVSNSVVAKKDGYWGLIDSNNETVLPFEYKEIHFEEIITSDNLEGRVDYYGDFVIEPIYDDLLWVYGEYINPSYYAVKDNLIGIISTKNELILPIKFQYLQVISSEYIITSVNDKYGIIDFNQNSIMDFTYDLLVLMDYNEETDKYIFRAKNNGKYGLIDLDNNVLFDFKYDSFKFYENVIIIKKGELFAVFNYDGDILLDFIYTDVQYISDNEYLVEMPNKDYVKVTID